MPSRTLGRRFLNASCYLAYLLGASTLLLYGIYRVREFSAPVLVQPKYDPIPGMEPELLAKIGFFSNEKSSAYYRFPLDKPEGVVRLGCFGDSFTAGSEVADPWDYPAILGRLLLAEGLQVEVLNFGVGGYGFHQSATLALELTQRYHLDALLLGPKDFHHDRDQSFTWRHSTRELPLLHGRWILSGDDLRQLLPLGETPRERAAIYQGFLPSWHYLRYDAALPPFLNCLLPPGRTLHNPFFYHPSGPVEEVEETWRRLLRRIDDLGRPVVLCHSNPAIVELVRKLRLPRMVLAPVHFGETFPFLAPQGHNSPLGNLVVARQVLDHLRGRAASPFARPTYSPFPSAVVPHRNAGVCDRLELSLGTGLEGYLVQASGPGPHSMTPSFACDQFKAGKFLLGFTGVNGAWPEAAYLLLDRASAVDQALVPSSTEDGSNGRDLIDPEPSFLAEGLPIALLRVRADFLAFDRHLPGLRFRRPDPPGGTSSPWPRRGTTRLSMANGGVLEFHFGEEDFHLVAWPEARWLLFATYPNVPNELLALPSGGALSLRLFRDDHPFELPLGTWRAEVTELPLVTDGAVLFPLNGR